MRFWSVILMLSGTFLFRVEVLANGFFHENDGTPINLTFEMYSMPQDHFIDSYYNPHNYYNPYINHWDILSYEKEKLIGGERSTDILPIENDNTVLNRKSEQAIRQNRQGSVDLALDNILGLVVENTTELTDLGLSDLTSSSLIVSARKKQFFEKLFPMLLNNQSMIYRDRERLVELVSSFEQGNNICSSDEKWLRKMAQYYGVDEK